MFGNHGLCGLPEEGAHEKSPKCLDGNLGDFEEFCKGLNHLQYSKTKRPSERFFRRPFINCPSFFSINPLLLKSPVISISNLSKTLFRDCFGVIFYAPPADKLFMAWLYHIGFLRNGSSWSPLTSSQMVRPIWGPSSTS